MRRLDVLEIVQCFSGAFVVPGNYAVLLVQESLLKTVDLIPMLLRYDLHAPVDLFRSRPSQRGLFSGQMVHLAFSISPILIWVHLRRDLTLWMPQVRFFLVAMDSWPVDQESDRNHVSSEFSIMNQRPVFLMQSFPHRPVGSTYIQAGQGREPSVHLLQSPTDMVELSACSCQKATRSLHAMWPARMSLHVMRYSTGFRGSSDGMMGDFP